VKRIARDELKEVVEAYHRARVSGESDNGECPEYGIDCATLEPELT
jgi:hypothetical protein